MKENSRKWLAFFVIPLLLIPFLAAWDTTSLGVKVGDASNPKGGPPSHAPAHGYRAKYAYHYHPSAQVYFDVSRKVYFYLEGGSWRMSVSLPESLKVKLGDYVTIEMDTDKPYTHFEEHKREYPPG